VRTIGTKVSETEFVKEIHFLIDAWKKVQAQALLGSGPALVHREEGITTSVIRDMFSDDVSQVYVDHRDDHEEILKYLRTVSPELCKRVVFYSDRLPLFDKFNIEKDLDLSLRRKVWLKGGGYILFDHTEALLAIDVNTGRNVGKTRVEETIFRTNMEAAKEIGRQFRLRDIGGQIVIDFIDMAKADHRRQVEDCMRSVLNKGGTAASMTGLSKFCMMEITRKRVRPELRELYTDVCHVCNGLGWVFSPATVSTRIDRWLRRSRLEKTPGELSLAVHPSVAEFLRRDNGQIVRMLEKQHKTHLHVTEDPELDSDEFQFYSKGQSKPIGTGDGAGS
jgi:ribonuclease G